MFSQEQPNAPPGLAEMDHRRIDRLVYEVEKLVALLEEERLVEPSKMLNLKRELKALEQGA